MHHTPYTPTASRTPVQSAEADDALIAEARRVLLDALVDLPVASAYDTPALRTHFNGTMAPLCVYVRARDVPIEKLLVAVKLAWATLGEPRARLGEAAPDVLGGVVSACIECYFAGDARERAD